MVISDSDSFLLLGLGFLLFEFLLLSLLLLQLLADLPVLAVLVELVVVGVVQVAGVEHDSVDEGVVLFGLLEGHNQLTSLNSFHAGGSLHEDRSQSVLELDVLIVGREPADLLENIQRLHHSLVPELYMEHAHVLLLEVELSEFEDQDVNALLLQRDLVLECLITMALRHVDLRLPRVLDRVLVVLRVACVVCNLGVRVRLDVPLVGDVSARLMIRWSTTINRILDLLRNQLLRQGRIEQNQKRNDR